MSPNRQGLSAFDVLERRRISGFNDLPSSKAKSFWGIAKEVLQEPMFLLLLGCGALYMFIGDYREGMVQLLAILIIIVITFIQYRKTERALDALRSMAAPKAFVIRDGVELEIEGREVVPGDLLVVREGCRIVADAVLLDAVNLMVDEAMLTGESVPVNKALEDDLKTNEALLYSGTMVVRGQGLANVLSVGTATRFGQIGLSLSLLESGDTRLQQEMKTLIRTLFLIGVIISIGVVLAFYFTRGGFIQALLNGLAASMSILPEEFPVVATVFLALGAWRLSQKKVLTRKPSAIESLGSATVLCVDKTGTITQNKMEVAALYDGMTLIFKKNFAATHQNMISLLHNAKMASSDSSSDPMEQAIAQARDALADSTISPRLVKEYPLSRALLSMTRVVQFSETDPLVVAAKGSPEAIFKLCKMDAVEMDTHLLVVHQLAELGYRVLGVANAPSQSLPLPESQHGFSFVFDGLIALADPIRPEVPKAVEECIAAGIRVIMITGDFPTTAKSIARQIGLPEDGDLVSGDVLSSLTDAALADRINRVSVFARVAPEQKLRIVESLKAKGEIVAMTGDGVNDAPALKAAHIGIAMGLKGTDVARESSTLVLLDDQFTSIVEAIRQGRRIYDNMQKAMSYIMAIHIPIIGLVLLPAFISSIPILLMPLHIVFMELIIDPVCSVAFESEQEERDIMKRPPRSSKAKFFGWSKIGWSILEGVFVLLAVCVVYLMSKYEGHSDGQVRALAFSTLIVGNITLILTNLSKSRSFLAVFKEKNHTASIFVLAGFTMLLAILFIPYLRSLFSFEMPTGIHFLPVLLTCLLLLFLLESIKLFNRYVRLP